jgi:hypothetical protein
MGEEVPWIIWQTQPPTKNLIEPKLYMNPTKNLIELKLYMNPTKKLIDPKLYMQHEPH